MTDQPSVTVADLLRIVRRDAIMRKAIDPSAPDPVQFVARLEDLARRYPPIAKGDGYDFGPMVHGAAVEYGLDETALAETFLSAGAAVARDHAAAVKAAEEPLRGGS